MTEHALYVSSYAWLHLGPTGTCGHSCMVVTCVAGSRAYAGRHVWAGRQPYEIDILHVPVGEFSWQAALDHRPTMACWKWPSVAASVQHHCADSVFHPYHLHPCACEPGQLECPSWMHVPSSPAGPRLRFTCKQGTEALNQRLTAHAVAASMLERRQCSAASFP